MNPDDFLRDLAQTSEADQGLASFRTMATMFAVFHAGLLDERVEPYAAIRMTIELIRCTIGDHKPA